MEREEFISKLVIEDQEYHIADIHQLQEKGVADINKLPFSIKILVENLLRKLDGRIVREEDLLNIARWQKRYDDPIEIPYHPARVLMQDFTGVPAVVDLAAMRDAIKDLGGDPMKINPLVPVDLIVDHSVQVDYYGTPDALKKNVAKEYERNGFATVLYLRLIYFPFTPMNFGMGLTSVRFWDYFAGTGLGIIVGTFIFTFFIGTIKDVWVSGDWGQLISFKVFFSVALFIFSFFLPKIIKKIKGEA